MPETHTTTPALPPPLRLPPKPGQPLLPDEILGREEDLALLLRHLQRGSVILTAERRTGKSSLLTLLSHEERPDFPVLLADMEGLSTASDFTARVLEDICGHQSLGHRVWGIVEKTLRAISRVPFRFQWGPAEVGRIEWPEAVKASWREILTRSLTDVSEATEGRICLCWDEFPLMLGKILRKEGLAAASDLLDTLKTLRQECPKLRFVFSGSVGLHHTLREMTAQGYRGSPFADMTQQILGGIDLESGVRLARALFAWEGLCPDADTLQALVLETGGLPYYIHLAVEALAMPGLGASLSPERVNTLFRWAVSEKTDPWRLREQWVQRIRIFYSADEAPVARALLDTVARNHPHPIPLPDLLERLSVRLSRHAEELDATVDLLCRDGWLTSCSQGSGVKMAAPLVAAVWTASRQHLPGWKKVETFQ